MERQKEFGYHRILEALQRLEGFSHRSLVSIIESGEYHANQPQDVEYSDLTRQARTEIAQAVKFSRHVLSKTTLELMTAYEDELNEHLCRNWLERLDYNHNITKKYIRLLAAAAKQDLQSDA